MSDPIRAALERFIALADEDLLCPGNPAETDWGAVKSVLAEACAALAAKPQLTDEQLFRWLGSQGRLASDVRALPCALAVQPAGEGFSCSFSEASDREGLARVNPAFAYYPWSPNPNSELLGVGNPICSWS